MCRVDGPPQVSLCACSVRCRAKECEQNALPQSARTVSLQGVFYQRVQCNGETSDASSFATFFRK